MISTDRYLTDQVVTVLRREIAEADGAEIFAVLRKSDGSDLFDSVAVVARGTGAEVPALVTRVRWGDMSVHNHPTGVLRPSQADLRVATLFGEEGVGSMIVDNQVQQCYVVVEPSRETDSIDIAIDDVTRLFQAQGPLSRQMSNFELREGQVAMSAQVARALNVGEVLTVEAGTGTGKSLAYLLPSMLWAKANRKRVVIATKTIALQEQLVYKDIPLAQKMMENAPSAALIKGRGNYVCHRKLQDVVRNQLQLFADEDAGTKSEIQDLADWVLEHQVGDKADLPFMPTHHAWDAIRSDSDMCLGAKCPHFQVAPFYQSRRAAAKASILVVNQALLFSDLAVRHATGNHKAAAVIPPYDAIILDEAHSIEDIATDHFAQKISSFGLRIALGKLLSARGNAGLLVRLRQFFQQQGDGELLSQFDATYPGIREGQEAVYQALEAFSAEIHDALNPQSDRQVEIWLDEVMLQSGRLAESRRAAEDVLVAMALFMRSVRMVRATFDALDDEQLQKSEGMRLEFSARLQRLESMMNALKTFAVKHDPNLIPWVVLRRMRNARLEFDYKVSPLEIAPMLKQALFSPYHCVIMTSATLNIRDDFAFFSSRTGLATVTDKVTRFSSVPSPFCYPEQAQLIVPDLGVNPDAGQFAGRIADLIVDLARMGAGGTLVLFTSYALLNRVAGQLEFPLANMGVELLVQGQEQRSTLVHRLKQGLGVLLGTDSFWEGVDLPGLALSKLVITKLPFPQVNDPIFAARSEAIKQSGQHPFMSYALPLALLKFKQGAGRLIRSRSDRGILVVCDRRMIEKSYGRRFVTQVEDYPLSRGWPPIDAGVLDLL